MSRIHSTTSNKLICLFIACGFLIASLFLGLTQANAQVSELIPKAIYENPDYIREKKEKTLYEINNPGSRSYKHYWFPEPNNSQSILPSFVLNFLHNGNISETTFIEIPINSELGLFERINKYNLTSSYRGKELEIKFEIKNDNSYIDWIPVTLYFDEATKRNPIQQIRIKHSDAKGSLGNIIFIQNRTYNSIGFLDLEIKSPAQNETAEILIQIKSSRSYKAAISGILWGNPITLRNVVDPNADSLVLDGLNSPITIESEPINSNGSTGSNGQATAPVVLAGSGGGGGQSSVISPSTPAPTSTPSASSSPPPTSTPESKNKSNNNDKDFENLIEEAVENAAQNLLDYIDSSLSEENNSTVDINNIQEAIDTFKETIQSTISNTTASKNITSPPNIPTIDSIDDIIKIFKDLEDVLKNINKNTNNVPQEAEAITDNEENEIENNAKDEAKEILETIKDVVKNSKDVIKDAVKEAKKDLEESDETIEENKDNDDDEITSDEEVIAEEELDKSKGKDNSDTKVAENKNKEPEYIDIDPDEEWDFIDEQYDDDTETQDSTSNFGEDWAWIDPQEEYIEAEPLQTNTEVINTETNNEVVQDNNTEVTIQEPANETVETLEVAEPVPQGANNSHADKPDKAPESPPEHSNQIAGEHGPGFGHGWAW